MKVGRFPVYQLLPTRIAQKIVSVGLYAHHTHNWMLSNSQFHRKKSLLMLAGELENFGAHSSSSPEPLKKHHLVKLWDLFTLNVYKIYYKLRHVSLPTYVANMFKDFSRNHEHETRQALILDEPNVNTSNGENCIRYLLPRIINKTNQTIVTMVDTYSNQGFVNFVKNDMIGHYIENCSISNCYICNHTHSEWLPLTYSEWVSFNIQKKIKKIK